MKIAGSFLSPEEMAWAIDHALESVKLQRPAICDLRFRTGKIALGAISKDVKAACTFITQSLKQQGCSEFVVLGKRIDPQYEIELVDTSPFEEELTQWVNEAGERELAATEIRKALYSGLGTLKLCAADLTPLTSSLNRLNCITTLACDIIHLNKLDGFLKAVQTVKSIEIDGIDIHKEDLLIFLKFLKCLHLDPNTGALADLCIAFEVFIRWCDCYEIESSIRAAKIVHSLRDKGSLNERLLLLYEISEGVEAREMNALFEIWIETGFSASQFLKLVASIKNHASNFLPLDLLALLTRRKDPKYFIKDFELATLLVNEYLKITPVENFFVIWLDTNFSMKQIQELDKALGRDVFRKPFIGLLKGLGCPSDFNSYLTLAKSCKVAGQPPVELLDHLPRDFPKDLRFFEFAIYASPRDLEEGFVASLLTEWESHKEWLRAFSSEEMEKFGTLCHQFTCLHPSGISVPILRLLMEAEITKLPNLTREDELEPIPWTKAAIVLASFELDRFGDMWSRLIERLHVSEVTFECIQNITDYINQRHDAPQDKRAQMLGLLTGGRIDLESLDKSAPTCPSGENALMIADNYVVRVPNWQGTAYGDQLTFGLEMHRSIQMGRTLLANGNSFNDLIKFFAFRRGVIADLSENNRDIRHRYGKPRTEHFCTPSRQRYEQIAWRMVRGELNHIPIDAVGPTEMKPIPESIHKECRAIYTNIDGESLPLSQFVLVKGDLSLLNGNNNFNDPTPGLIDTRVAVFHAFPVEKIQKGMKIVETLFREAISRRTTKEQTFTLLAKIYWWICQIKPWKAGDPSIAEMLIRSIALHRGIELGPWKEGLISWVEVVCEPTADAFAAKFTTCFESH